MSLQLMSYTMYMYTRQFLNALALKSFASLAYTIESGCPNSQLTLNWIAQHCETAGKEFFLSMLRSATGRPGEFFPPLGVHFYHDIIPKVSICLHTRYNCIIITY